MQEPSDPRRHDSAARVRANQIRGIMRFTPLAAIANCFNAVLVAYVALPVADWRVLVLWLAAIGIVMGLALRTWFVAKRRPARQTASPRAIQRATLQASVLALLWGVVPVLWFPGSDPFARMVMGMVVTGMICAGGFALATVARAAVTYVSILGAAAIIGLGLSQAPYALVLGFLLASYCTVVLKSVESTATLFADQFRTTIELRERGELIELLLAEFQDNASDWLFETDATGTITKHSARFSVVAGRELAGLSGIDFADLLAPSAAAAWSRALEAGQPFRDLVVETRGATPHWWSLTARPIFDESRRITGWRGVGSDITETKIAQDRLAYLATTDKLTGFMNRTAFAARAAEALAAAEAAGECIAIGILDLDEFKQVNDTLGHAAGDRLLHAVARDLMAAAGARIEIARLGGDEFGVLFLSDPGETTIDRARRLIGALAHPYAIDGETVTVGASIGIAHGPRDGADIDMLMRNADVALYRAKAEGGGMPMVYDAAMHREAEEQRRLKEDLALALARGEISLAYQPVVDVATNRTIGFEALARWTQPERGEVSPATFVPIAERSGLITVIGAFVLREACRAAAGWPGDLWVSVNVSPVQIARADMAGAVRQALALTGLPANRLELEITETVFLRHEAETMAFIQAARAMGVTITLDDFGTGYSALGYLGRFPLDKIKIDRTFVTGPIPLARRSAIMQAIIGMARGLGMTTTAEGVEDESVLAWLRLHGCTLAQGYHFARPMPASEIPAYLAREETGLRLAAPARIARAARAARHPAGSAVRR
ncbi:putative bifunctional diguanylate cyclase/phosphodiesterase [Rhabdaerophilum calidifontis]|uniref:putative bifunctional diguanylate cyclase/phosphodiesterase n=1 Tax=Rhabdaerophilum calidifontis TaxID=2604328 RepID=UPI00140C1D47|nr:EAL domain-containing protein [Rhabdaerophilum calidifontis]